MPNNEFGDFQTPLALARRCLEVLALPQHGPIRVLEPTCGRGAFLRAAKERNPTSIRYGIDINADYVQVARNYGTVAHANIFTRNLTDISWPDPTAPLFIIGNPPWVTAAELNRMGSNNIPPKKNYKGMPGIAALLGSSNFDVCEYIILKALTELRGQPLRLGMLCKTHVARNVLVECARARIQVATAALYPINARRWFNAEVDACWFTLTIDPALPQGNYAIDVHENLFEGAGKIARRWGVVGTTLVSDLDAYQLVRSADGPSPYTWRSGLKHDAARVFEFTSFPENLESEYIYPLLKGTDVFRGRHQHPSRWVLVPQHKFGEDTAHLQYTAPKVWRYLIGHAAALDNRKSMIYRNRPRFSVFGHGDYTFAPLKVSCSGMHKESRFQLVTQAKTPRGARPVVLDDTCYFLPFENSTHAALVTAILRSPECQAFIQSLVFWDAKRPITKKLLSHIDLFALPCDRSTIRATAAAIAADAGVRFDADAATKLF